MDRRDPAREKVEITRRSRIIWSARHLASAPRRRTLTGLSVLPTELPEARLATIAWARFSSRIRAPWRSSVQAFETEGLIGTGAAPAVLSYLFHRIGGRLDGRPTLLIVDEGWLALDDEDFAGQLRELLKTLRKKNASVVFATQSLSDIDGSAIAPAIISCPTRLLLPNERRQRRSLPSTAVSASMTARSSF
jgi:type IV secretion system protein VirB4